jgi:hypothetical protein
VDFSGKAAPIQFSTTAYSTLSQRFSLLKRRNAPKFAANRPFVSASLPMMKYTAAG